MEKGKENSFFKRKVLACIIIPFFPACVFAADVTCGSKPGYCYGNQELSTSDGDVSSNFSGATYSGTGENYVYGAAAQKDSGTGNVDSNGSLTIEANANFVEEAYGADSQLNVNNGGSATTTSGTLTMNAGSAQTSSTVGFAVGGNAANQYGDANVKQGVLIMNSASVAHDALGARAFGGQQGSGGASAVGSASLDNLSKVSGNLYGAYAQGMGTNGGASSTGTVSLSDSSVLGSLSGAYSLGNQYANASGTITIQGNSSINNVFGAFAEANGTTSNVSTYGKLNILSATMNDSGSITTAYSINTGTTSTLANATMNIQNILNQNSASLYGAYASASNTTSQSGLTSKTDSFEVSNSNLGSIVGAYGEYNGTGTSNILTMADLNISDSNLSSTANSLYGVQLLSNSIASGATTLNLTNVNAAGNVYGASLQAKSDANATAAIKVSGGKLRSLYGANVTGSTAKAFSTLTLEDVNITGNLYGSQAMSPASLAIADNNLSISNSQVAGNIYGAFSHSSVEKSVSNVVNFTIDNASVGKYSSNGLYGSYAYSKQNANATTENFSIQGGSKITASIYGSYADLANNAASKTTNFIISNGDGSNKANSVFGNVYGAYAKTNGESNATTSMFYIGDTKITTPLLGFVYNDLIGAYANSYQNNAIAILDSNFTIANKSSVDGNISASFAVANNGIAKAFTGNMFITNSQVGDLQEESYLHGSYASALKDANATTSSLRILDGALVDSIIYGSYAESSNGNAYSTTNLFSLNNIENDSNKSVNGDIYGAYSLSSSGSANSLVDTFYLNNTNVGDLKNSNLYGAYAESNTSANATIGSGNFSVLGASTVSGNLYGAYALGDGEAQATTKTVTVGASFVGSNKDNNLSASFSLANDGNASATSDYLALYNGSEINATIKGSYAQALKGEANATMNIFAISNDENNTSQNKINGDVYAAYAEGEKANADVGEVYVSNSSINYGDENNNFSGAYAEASQGDAKASVNTSFAFLNGSSLDGNITGATAIAQNGQASASSGNIFVTNSNLGDSNNESYFYGTYAEAGEDANASTANFRILNGTEVDSSIYAAYAESSNGNAYATNGLLSINNVNQDKNSSIINGNIYGAYAQSNNATAQAQNGDFYISNAEIGGTVASNVAGAYASANLDANASFANDNSEFSILGSKVSGNLYGAYAYSQQGNANASAGDIYIDSSSIASQGDTLTGAYAFGKGNLVQANLSSFIVYDGSVINAANTYGVSAVGGTLSNANIESFALGNLNNKEKNIINGNVYGAYVSTGGEANANAKEIYVANSKITGDFTGLYSIGMGKSTASTSSTIQILNGTTIDGDLTGAFSASLNDASNAKADILISNSTLGEEANNITGSILGALSNSGAGISATASSNITLLNTKVDGNITVAFANSNGAKTAVASGNSLTLENSTLSGNIYLGAINSAGTANNNVINIYSGNTINSKEIWGGYNTSNYYANISDIDLVKGNTFNFYAGANPIKVEKLRNFDTYNIETWGQGVKLFNNDKNSAFITVTGEIGNDTLTSNGTHQSTINVFNSGITFADGETLKAGDKMYILNADGATIINGKNMSDAFKLGNNKINVGLIYKAGINIGQNSDQSVYAEITNPIPRDEDKNTDIWHYIGGGTYDNTANAGTQTEPTKPDHPDKPSSNKPDEDKHPIKKPTNPDENLNLPSNPVHGFKPTNPDENVTAPQNPLPAKTKPPFTTDQHAVDRLKPTLEGRLASIMAVDGSFNAVIDDIWKKLELANEGDIIPFALLQGSHDRYNSGSHVKNNGFDLIAGSAYNFSHSLAGWFYEYGKGNYDTYNFFPAYDNFEALDFKASGKLTHSGIGLLGKTYIYNDKIYFDGGLRYGRLKNKFETSSFTDGNYRAVNPNYTDRANYFGAYAGTGFLASLAQKHNFDTSVKYLYNEVQKSDVTIDGSKITFDKTISSRIKIAEDYKYETNKYLALTAGLAYEYEFNGKAKGSIDGNEIKSPKMKGSTGIGSLGVRLTPFNGGDKNKAIDFSVKGYTGKHEGVSGNINFQYNFN